jgi:hypothetical protein
MRPIVWGLILTALGAFFWILFSVVFGITYAFAGEIPPVYMALIYISGLAMFFSLPITLVIEIYHWLKKRRAKRT